MLKTSDKLPQHHSTEFKGMPVIVEWPAGSTRIGTRPDGTTFKTEMKGVSYGYIPDTSAAGDLEKLDVYIGPDEGSEYAYIVEQLTPEGDFDEYKVVLGYDSLKEAEAAYVGQAGEDLMGDISEVDFEYLFDTVKEKQRDAAAKKEATKFAGEKYTVIEAFLKNYKHEVDFYDEVAHLVQDKLSETLQETGIKAVVSSRAKSPDRLEKKLQKRNVKKQYKTFREIYDDIVDLAGCRVALYMPADRGAVGKIIGQLFVPIRPAKSFPEASKPEEGDTLGYVATHYLVHLRPETLRKKELRYADTQIEIQVASILMHAWSEISHDLIYKPEKGSLTPEEQKALQNLNVLVKEGEKQLEELQASMESRDGESLRFDVTAALAGVLKDRSAGKVAYLTVAAFKNALDAIGGSISHTINQKLVRKVEFVHRPFSGTDGRMEIKYGGELVGSVDYLVIDDNRFKVTESHIDSNFKENGLKMAAIIKLQKALDRNPDYTDALRRAIYVDSVSGSTKGLTHKRSPWANYAQAAEILRKARWQKQDVVSPETRKKWESVGVVGDETHFLNEAMDKLAPGKPYNTLWVQPNRHEIIALAQQLKDEAKNRLGM
jgi:ppGpp synthetase/RelA/SpoT-type nucleotidyltranferase